MSLSIPLSGIDAATTDLNTISNNIANASSTGFKSSTAEFADVFANSPYGVSTIQQGNGVAVSTVAQNFTQGDVQTTGNDLNMAISGQGFFIVNNAGATQYTRDGAFQQNQAGVVQTASGATLQIYPPNAGGGFNIGTLTDLTIPSGGSPPLATTTGTLTLNLPSGSAVPTVTPFSQANSASYTDSTSMTVYDSLGAAHTATLYFSQTSTANQWTAQLAIDGNLVGTAQTLDYSQSGVLTTPSSGNINFGSYTPATGGNPLDVTFNLSQSTQYGSTFGVTSVSQNGYTTGQLTGINVSATGIVQAQYTNGQAVSLGQIAMANFANPQGLEELSNTNWAQTYSSGAATQGQAGQSGLGQIQSGALESSNVDLTAQLVNMITAQQAFQANSQAITDNDQNIQTILHIQ
jgi:flagellar hook protein FlgE